MKRVRIGDFGVGLAAPAVVVGVRQLATLMGCANPHVPPSPGCR